MKKTPAVHTLVMLGMALLALPILTACISVSRQAKQQPVTPGGSRTVPDRGLWDVDQEWQCTQPSRFVLEHERAIFNAALERWLDDGWEMTDFDVVTVPAQGDQVLKTCLVGTFRRPRS